MPHPARLSQPHALRAAVAGSPEPRVRSFHSDTSRPRHHPPLAAQHTVTTARRFRAQQSPARQMMLPSASRYRDPTAQTAPLPFCTLFSRHASGAQRRPTLAPRYPARTRGGPRHRGGVKTCSLEWLRMAGSLRSGLPRVGSLRGHRMVLEVAGEARGHHAERGVVELGESLQQLQREDAAVVRALPQLVESSLEHR